MSNTFGRLRSDGGTPAGNAPKAPVSSAKGSAATEAKTAQAVHTPPLPPADPRVQSILDTRRGDGKTVREKLDADSPAYILKAAQDHYNQQKAAGEAPDAASRFYLNSTARHMLESGVKDARILPGKLAEVFDKEQIRKNLDEIAKDPAFLAWATGQQANAVEDTVKNNPDIADLLRPHLQEGENYVNALRRMQSDYLTSQEFADAVAKQGKDLVTEGMKMLSSFGLGEKEMRGVGNTLAENVRSKVTPDAPRPVIDPNTNKPIQTEDGHDLAILPDGTNIALNAQGNPVADTQGNAWVYYQDGTYKLDEGRRFIQYDAGARATFAFYDGTKYLIGPDRKARYDTQGRPLVLDSGTPVALGADGKAATDAAGNKQVFDPATGKAVTDPASGNAVVIDPATKGVVQAGADGKVVSAANGDPYAVDRSTGKFVQDAQGRYVQISKENAAPGIVPGYAVDANNTKVVVSPANGRPLVDPGTGKTVVFTPARNAPELVPLDASGKPLLAEDGRNIVYDPAGNTIVSGDGTGHNWLVDAGGKFAHDGNGHYIGVGPKSGLASPVDAKDAPVQNGNGQVPLWDAKTNALMTTADGSHQIVLDKTGNLLQNDAEGKTIVEEKTGLPYLVDPRTRSVAVNPDTGRWIMLDTSGAAVEYNADDGTKHLINPATNTTVKASTGQSITIDDKAALPVAVNADGSMVKNPATGNTVVYDINGHPAFDPRSGGKVEITPGGKAHVIDPRTLAPFGSRDKATGGLQLYNKDGSEQTDPGNGNKVQIDPNGQRVEVDAATGKFAADAFGNTLVLGPDNAPLKTPDGLSVVVDKRGAPVAVGADGKVGVDPVSGLPRVINADTGSALEDPVSKAPAVVDPKTGAPVQADPKSGALVADPVTGLSVVVNPKTGAQAKGPNGEAVGVAPGLSAPVYFDKQINALTLADPITGKAVTNPDTGAKVVIDPQFGVPVQVLPDKEGSLVLVDDKGRPRTDGLGYVLYLNKETGRVTIKLADGREVDAATVKAPEKAEPKATVQAIPYPPRIPPGGKLPAKEADATTPPAPQGNEARPASPEQPLGQPGPSGTSNNPVIPPRIDADWARPDYFTTQAERDAFVQRYTSDYVTWNQQFVDKNFHRSYEQDAAAIEYLKKLSGNEGLQNIPTEDLVALRVYTRGGFALIINHGLYNGWTQPGHPLEPYYRSIQSALNHMDNNGFAYEGPVVRFTDLDDDVFARMFREGDYYRVNQFLSTSSDIAGWDWNGDIKITINNARGVSVESISPFPSQREVIIPPNELTQTTSIDEWIFPLESLDEDSISSEPSTGKGKQVVLKGVDETTVAPRPATPAPAPADASTMPETPTVDPVATNPAAARAAGKWSALGKVLGTAGEALGIGTGILQAVSGGFQINDGIRSKNPYDIAAGAFNVTSGALGVSAGAASLMGGAAAAAVAPLAVAAAFAGMVGLIIDILKHQDDHKKFADKLGELFNSLGILKDGWHDKAAQIYYDSQGEPDPAPIAHGNLP